MTDVAILTEREELVAREEDCRNQLEQLAIFDHSNCRFADIVEEAVRRRQASLLRRIRDIDQGVDHAFRR